MGDISPLHLKQHEKFPIFFIVIQIKAKFN